MLTASYELTTLYTNTYNCPSVPVEPQEAQSVGDEKIDKTLFMFLVSLAKAPKVTLNVNCH